jgi:hypothetical protein
MTVKKQILNEFWLILFQEYINPKLLQYLKPAEEAALRAKEAVLQAGLVAQRAGKAGQWEGKTVLQQTHKGSQHVKLSRLETG